LDVAGAKYPTEFAGNRIKPLQGKSLTPVFRKEAFEREAIYWEHEGNRAVRFGDWKLVAKGQMRDRSQPVQWELYNIAQDRNENNDLIKEEDELASKLKKMWQVYAESCDVFPAPEKRKTRNIDLSRLQCRIQLRIRMFSFKSIVQSRIRMFRSNA
jgi:arylsulfatase